MVFRHFGTDQGLATYSQGRERSVLIDTLEMAADQGYRLQELL